LTPALAAGNPIGVDARPVAAPKRVAVAVN
jgi:hypothetical protein